MDGDGQHDPQNILEMLRIINAGGVDLVIGSRFFNVNQSNEDWVADFCIPGEENLFCNF